MGAGEPSLLVWREYLDTFYGVKEHVIDQDMVGNPEGEVQVRVAVAAVHGERPHGSSGDDAPILLREP